MAFALVQSTSGLTISLSSAGTKSTVLTSTPGVGHLIVLAIANATSNVAPAGVLDGNSNAMTLIGSQARITASSIYIYAYIAGASQSLTYTVNGASIAWGLDVFEFSGNYAATNGTASTFYDVAPGTSSYAAQSLAGDNGAAPSITTTTAGDMIFSVLGVGTNMASTGTTSMGDPNGTGTWNFAYATTTAVSYVFDGYSVNPSVGLHAPYLQGSTGTARAGAAVTVAFLAAATTTNTQGILLGM